MPDSVYAVTVAWNHRADTLACLASLQRSTVGPVRVVVVDNGSSDGTPAAVRQAYPEAIVIELGENRGFAVGANTGLRRALAEGAEQILLLNNDTEVAPDMLERLLAQTQPDTGIVAPLILYADPPDVIWSAGGVLRPRLLEQTGNLRGQTDRGGWPALLTRDFVPGCAMLLNRSLLELTGDFDERFFMYYEDFDLCLRARRAGYRIVVAPAARMWHKVSLSSGGADSTTERYHMARSSVCFYRKHVRGLSWLLVLPYRTASALKTTARLLAADAREPARAYWQGLRDGWKAK